MPVQAPLAPRSFAFEATATGIPAIIIQVTELVRSYMIWMGTTDADVADASDLDTIERLVAAQGSLAKDWACVMPPVAVRELFLELGECQNLILKCATLYHAVWSCTRRYSTVQINIRGCCASDSAKTRCGLVDLIPCTRKFTLLIAPVVCKARRFNKQIFLSVDAPNSFGNLGQSAHIILHMEKLLVKTLLGLENSQNIVQSNGS